jgi:SAM-dependent methyltransferase
LKAQALSLARRLRWWATRHAPAGAPGAWFELDDIEELRRLYGLGAGAQGAAWQPYQHAHMRLPAWFQQGLDPWSPAYAAQQHRLWAAIAGVPDRPYDAGTDEADFGWETADPILRPGFYQRRDAMAVDSAADHLLATGMLLKHSGLKPGDWALEYGAGFAQTALALARLDVKVDTIDVSPRFCEFVNRQAEHFQVPLTGFHGQFGDAPRPGQRYKLIWFYEAFHHCVDFMRVVPKLAELLDEGGRVILGGEPIVEHEYAAVPYPWGVRLHSEVAVVMRQTRWFELGFSEAFLYELFRRSGLEGRRVDCEPSLFGRLYVFEPTARR